MSAVTDFDVGPLTWVKGEIDQALHMAGEKLAQFAGNFADATPLRHCITYLHQVSGAIQMVGLEGAARFSQEIEKLVEAVEKQEIPADTPAVEAVSQAIAALSGYLEELMNGQPDVPLRLFPAYRALFEIRGGGKFSESDLFFPDLTVRPPKNPDPLALAEAELPKFAKAERARFQRGLLDLLRGAAPKGLPAMKEALQAIERAQTLPAQRTFWWTALALIESLEGGGIEANAQVKQLCGQIDQQIRRLSEGSAKVADRVLREVLYFIARSRPVGDRVRQAKKLFELDDYLPVPAEEKSLAQLEKERLQPLLRELGNLLGAAKNTWLQATAGNSGSFKEFETQTVSLAEQSAALENSALRRLLDQISAAATGLSAQSAPPTETLAMEMATALLLAENALANYTELTGEFVQQADVQGRRLEASARGGAGYAGETVPLLDEMSRRAQEKLLLAQVGQEIHANLQNIEQVLDAFFRDHNKRGELPGTKPLLAQIHGAFRILELERAADLLKECETLIARFAEPDYAADQEELELVAEGLSSLDYYIDEVQRGRPDALLAIDPVLKRFAAFTGKPELAPEPTVEPAPEEAPETSIEDGLKDLKRQTQALLSQWQQEPANDGLREDLRRLLSSMQQDADLVGDLELKAYAADTLRLLEQKATEPPQQAAPVIAAPVVAAHETDEAIDAELLETFLEEANEVLAAIRASLDECAAQPHNQDALTIVRRSFHTLKGSGRMVGLHALGEVAWELEQLMNKWLQDGKPASADLLSVLAKAHDAFSRWIAKLQADGTVEVDADALLAEAEFLRTGVAPAVTHEAPAIAPEAEPAEAIEPAVIEVEAIGGELPEAMPAEAVAVEPEAGGEEEIPLPAEMLAPAAEVEAPIELEAAAAAGEVPEEVSPAAEIVTAEPTPVEAAAIAPAEETAESEITIGALTLSRTLYDIFLTEARQHQATLEQELAALRAAPEMPIRHEFMRAAHTLCGISRTVGFPALAELAHALELWLKEMFERPFPPTGKQLKAMSDGIAALGKMVQAIAEIKPPKPAKQLLRTLQSMLEKVLAVSPEAQPPAAEEKPAAPLAGLPPAETFPEPAPAAPAVPAIAIERRARPAIRDDLDEQLLPVFLEEAQELFPLAGSQLRAWRASPADAQASKGLQRTLHTLKGSARMAGAMQLGELTHHMETQVLAATEAGELPPALFDQLDAFYDQMGDLLERLQQGPQAVAEAAAPAAEQQQPVAAAAAPVETEHASRIMLRVRADLVDRLVNEAGEVSIARSRIEGEMLGFKRSLLDLTESVNRLRAQLRDVEIQAESQMQARHSLTREVDSAFDPLEFDRFTRLQELTRMMAESVNDVFTVQQNLLKNLDETEAALLAQGRMTKDLQQELLRARMVPLASISERLHRIVRQTARELGKRATLDIVGEQVELDRSVLEKMTAPFEHLLRNAIDHGLESADIRTGADKPEIGTIRLTSRQEGNEIVIAMSDDGAGLNLDAIRDKARTLGLLADGAQPTAAQLMNFIFAPGFSTASEITQLSGRGIGMDVVRNEITGLGGRIEVSSERGKGTTFNIHLPLTLAVTQVVLVRSGNATYAIPSSMVHQVQEFKSDALAEIYRQNEVCWQDRHYPLHYLPGLLGDRDAAPVAQRYATVMLLHSGPQLAAIHIDELLGNREAVVKNIGPQLARVAGIAGATVLGTGQVVLIINPVLLANRPELTAVEATRKAAPVAEPATAPLIMVVDDSLTVRKITSRLLIKEGYQVITAKDGVDALQLLEDNHPDVMLVDIEMPRMDGFELTRKVRSDPHTTHIPIIMITSRTAEKHRSHAKELGVNEYLGKPFQEDELLGHIAEFVRQRVVH